MAVSVVERLRSHLLEIPRISLPLSARGTAAACTAVGSENFSLVMACRRRASRFRLANVALVAVEGCASVSSGATASGISSEFSLRFMVR